MKLVMGLGIGWRWGEVAAGEAAGERMGYRAGERTGYRSEERTGDGASDGL